MKIQLLVMTIVLMLSACVTTVPEPAVVISEYENNIHDWHQARNDRLNQADGWLTLSGLFWLEPGENSFGGNGDNHLVFPGENVPEHMGKLLLEGDSVSISVGANIQIFLRDTMIVQGGLKKDSSGEPDILSWGSLSWYIIERGERIGVRLRDSKHPNYVNFKPTRMFPIDSSWRVPATLEPFDTSTTVDIVNVLGDTSPNHTPGILHFEIDGELHALTPLADPGDESYFIIFGDQTNGITSYGAGRFLVVPAVDEHGNTSIDFNKAYNMPCAFSPWATCPLPPEENLLSVEIKAGELNYDLEGGY